MSLSNELISQFVKITNDNQKQSKTDSTVYGTIKDYGGSRYIQLDGSDCLTPISSYTVAAKDGDRVTATISSHKLSVTGNLTSPATVYNPSTGSVSGITKDVSGKISDFDVVIADQVTVEDFTAAVGRIETLESESLTVQDLAAVEADIDLLQANDIIVDNKITAQHGDIESLKTDKLDASVAVATYATIDSLNATNADLYNLESTYANFEKTTTSDLEAVKASIGKLEAGDISTEVLDARYATITDLETERGKIATLQSDVADIDTLIFGSASGTTIQSSFANAVIAQLGNAQIKSAMIENVSASQITSGDIITNNVRVMSEDGSLVISDETIQISDDNRVRVQIGKDAAGDYSINIWDSDGNLMFYEGGITDNAITEAIIRNDMISDEANISAYKLDIASLFEEINGSAHTIQSSKILLDSEGQTLDVVFTDLTTDVENLKTNVSSQGTSLSVVQGKIDSKVWQQDIDSSIENIDIGGRNLYGFHKGVTTFAHSSSVTTVVPNHDEYGATITVMEETNTILMRISNIGFNVINAGEEPFTFSAVMYASSECEVRMDICDVGKTSVSLTAIPQKISFTAYPLKYCDASSQYNGFVDLEGSLPVGTIIYLENIKIERGTIATDFTVAPEDLEYVTDDLDERTNTLSTKYTSLEQTVDGINVIVADHTTQISEKADQSDVVAVEEQVAQLDLSVDEFKTTVSNTYATKSALTDAVDNVDVGGRNLVLNSNAYMQVSTTEDFVSTEITKIYKLSPLVADDTKGFLLGLKDGRSFTLSFDVCFSRAYADDSLALTRVGAYIPFKFTHTDGSTATWYGTHTWESVKTNRHTIDAMGENSLEVLSETEESFVGRYSCYVTPSNSTLTILKNFYANPDDYTVSVTGVNVEFKGFTTGGYITNVKMEVGNKATDWTPAPEDLETRVTNAETSIKQNADSITSLATRTSDNETSISTLKQTSTSLISRVAVVEKLEIGGRNLALDTSESKTYTMTTETGSDSWAVCNSYWQHGILLEVSKTYTLSFDYSFDWGEVEKPTSASGIGVGIGSNGSGGPGSYLTDTFAMNADYWIYGDGGYDEGRFVYTLTNYKTEDIYFAFRMLRSFNSSGAYDVTGVTLTISNFKVEIGNKVTDWTPAPEDMATVDELENLESSAILVENRVTTTESLIQQLTDSITMLVTDGNGESLMVQTENGWTFSTAQIQEAVNSASENLNSLSNEVTDMDSTINSLQQAVDDLGILNDYVKIGTYENEPCIELGESDSDFKLLITNTKIMFMEGSGVPAYFNNQSMFIKNAVIEEELQQGEFVWKARSNGNLGLIWKGAAS